jgi:hypothetical protein
MTPPAYEANGILNFPLGLSIKKTDKYERIAG